jgi:uncharacterized protein (TIGR02611 family)
VVVFASSARLIRRIAVTIVGVAVVAGGIPLLALPGPGVLVIALGFLILSTEYDWARRPLKITQRKAAELANQAVSKPWSTVLSILGALGLVAAGIVWGLLPQIPFSSWWSGGGLIVGGLVALATIIVSLYQAKHKAPQPKQTVPFAYGGRPD